MIVSRPSRMVFFQIIWAFTVVVCQEQSSTSQGAITTSAAVIAGSDDTRSSSASEASTSGTSKSDSSALDVSVLVISIEDASMPFNSGVEVVFSKGEATTGFSCMDTGDKRSEEGSSIAYRSFELYRAKSSASSSFFEGVGSFLGSDEDDDDVDAVDASPWQLINAKVIVNGEDDKDGLPLLQATIEPSVSANDSMPVPREDSRTSLATLTVLYDCWRDGSASVELHLTISGANDGSTSLSEREVCIRWTKVCELGFKDLIITHNDKTVHPTNEDSTVLDLFDPEGVMESVTKLNLESTGAMRLRPPVVTSQQKFLKAEVRGPFFFSDTPEDAFEVSTQLPVEFSVSYTCESDGLADVTLTLEKAEIAQAHRPEKLELQWKKVCGSIAYRHLEVYIKSEANGTRSQAVKAGMSLPGYMRPCAGKPSKASAAQVAPAPAVSASSECSSNQPVFEVDPKEKRTKVEFVLDGAGAASPPRFQPSPDLLYDRKIMKAVIEKLPSPNWLGSARAKGDSERRSTSQNLVIKYFCHKDGVSNVMLTLHVLAHKPIDLVWRKRCTEPKVKVGKALTAPQALLIAFLVCGCLGLTICACFVLCGSDDDKKLLFKPVPNGSEDVEMSSQDHRLFGKKQEVAEVQYH